MVRNRFPSAPDVDLAVHSEKLKQLEASSHEHDTNYGVILRELSELSQSVALLNAKMDRANHDSARPHARTEPLKVAGLIAAITALAQVVAELARAVLTAHGG